MFRIALVLVLSLAGCAATPPPERPIGRPNPASAYCVEQGGRVEIRTGPAGEAGFCQLPDGRVIDEWELFRASRSDPEV